MKFEIKAQVTSIKKLFSLLPADILLTSTLPVKADGLADATFTSNISPEELKKLISQLTNAPELIDSIKIIYD